MSPDPDNDDFLGEAGDPAALDALADALSPVAPAASVRARLLASIEAPGRLHHFAQRVAALLDVSAERAAALLDRIDDAASWEPGPFDGVALFHIEGGPAVASAVTGFVRVEPGARFGEHTHLGAERVLLLTGSLHEEGTGAVARAGELVEAGAGTSHAFVARPGPALVYLAVIDEGVDIGGTVMRADDPRL